MFSRHLKSLSIQTVQSYGSLVPMETWAITSYCVMRRMYNCLRIITYFLPTVHLSEKNWALYITDKLGTGHSNFQLGQRVILSSSSPRCSVISGKRWSGIPNSTIPHVYFISFVYRTIWQLWPLCGHSKVLRQTKLTVNFTSMLAKLAKWHDPPLHLNAAG